MFCLFWFGFVGFGFVLFFVLLAVLHSQVTLSAVLGGSLVKLIFWMEGVGCHGTKPWLGLGGIANIICSILLTRQNAFCAS